ncbi:MAG: response regulator [Chloroflexi bacterium]|nr:response regulator [Chloroflexota bacterium]
MAASPTILYIEDNFDNRLLVKRVLQAEGYQVVEAPDGPTGIQLAEANQPDLILMDINLPHVDGYSMTARLKAMPHLARIPVVALTANVMRGDRERSLAAGCDGYIQKPIDVDQLPRQIARFLGKQTSPLSSAEAGDKPQPETLPKPAG